MNGRVHVVMPSGVRDPTRPSGGNAYDVRVCAELAVRGWSVLEHLVPGSWPQPDGPALGGLNRMLNRVLTAIPAGDVVLVDGLVGSTVPRALATHAGRLRLAVLVHMPLGQVPGAPAGVQAREREALTVADVVVVTSEWTRQWLLDAYRLDPSGIRVALPGADPAPVAPASHTGHRLLAVGPVSHAKGHDTLQAALDRLGHLDWRLDCVGSLRVDPDTAGRMTTWAAASGRADFRGPLAGAGVQRAYASADLLVHPSRSETYGMVVTEALARGVPVLASDVGGTREALGAVEGHAPGGLLVPPADVDALADALRTWLTDTGLRRRLREAALVRRGRLPRWAATASVVDDSLRSGALAGARP